MKTHPVNSEVDQSGANDNKKHKKEKARNRRKHRRLLITELCFDFAKNTSLHGLKYINERGISIFEKLFWLVTFIISVSLCSWLIKDVYTKWKTSPVIVSFSEQMVPVGLVPFPSITICPQRKVKQSVYNYTKELERYTEYAYNFKGDDNITEFSTEDVEMLQDVALLCEEYDGGWASRPFANESLVENIIEVSTRKADTFKFVSCKWHGVDVDCHELFDEVLTEEGLCLNYNSLAEEEILNNNSVQQDYNYTESGKFSNGWNMEDGYDENFNISETYPKRGRGNGASPDMFVMLQSSLYDYDSLCNPLSNGFKIFVHHPADMPHSSLYYYAALPKQVSSLALKFSALTTSERLKDYDPSIRQCYFPKDRQLRYFKTYTQNNCRIECKSNYTFEKCKCVTFDMPHYDSKSICTVGHMQCVREAKEELSARETKASIGMEAGACHCLPACNSITYDAEILKTEYNFNRKIKTLGKLYQENITEYTHGYAYSAIELYFKEPQYVSMRRSELFGLTDFMANIGGLLGLFLGFSFLSLVEIAYFATLRICCKLRKDPEIAAEDVEN